MDYITEYGSVLGTLTIASDGSHITGLWIEGQKYFMRSLQGEVVRCDQLETFEMARDWLTRYFAGKKPLPGELPLKPYGSGFACLVWELLCKIPYGEVTTYGALARQVADRLGVKSMSAQAVGGAVGRNPISILIPCHRVVGSDKSLTGYAGGLKKKRFLLTLEGALLEERGLPG